MNTQSVYMISEEGWKTRHVYFTSKKQLNETLTSVFSQNRNMFHPRF